MGKITNILIFLLGMPFGYVFALFLIDLRISVLKPDLSKVAVEQGVQAAIERYKMEYAHGEHLSARKRKARDQEVIKYIRKLEMMMEQTK